MVIRSYTAESVAAALKQVRTQMGGEAVVLKTRIVDDPRGQRQYEVTAVLDKPTVQQAGAVLKTGPDLPVAKTGQPVASRLDMAAVTTAAEIPSGLEDRLSAIENRLDLLVRTAQLELIGLPQEPNPSARAVEAMQAADVPTELITDFFKSLRKDLPTSTVDDRAIKRRLVARLESIIDKNLDLKAGDRVLVVGPAGAGKTSVIGRLAARLICDRKLAVKLVSLDSQKVGAIDEIASYADLLGVDDFAATDTADSATAADKDKVLLIDTAALPRDPKHLAEFRQRIQSLQPTHCLAVFSALMRTSDAGSYAREMAWLKPTHLVFTMTDLTRRLGSLLSVAAATGLKIAMTTNSSSAAAKSMAPDAETLAEIMLSQEAGCE